MSARLLVAVTSSLEAAFVTSVGASREVAVARRCADIPDLLAAAGAGIGTHAIVSADVPGLERDVVDQLHRLQTAVVGLVAEDDEAGERRLRQIGVSRVLPVGASLEEIERAITAAAPRHGPRGAGPDGASGAGAGTDSTYIGDSGGDLDDRLDAALNGDLEALRRPAAGTDSPVEESVDTHRRGQVVAVWGPTGAPGRTTIAVNLAAELAGQGIPALLIDADTFGSSVAQVLGLLDDTPGLATAARAAEQGTLDAPGLIRRAPEVSAGLRVLTGLPRADRWPEVRDGAMEHILQIARLVCDVVVVDCGFSVESDEELTFDTAAPRRNATTLTTLEAADHLVLVGAGDPVGLQRIVRALGELAHVPSPPPTVVVNKVRTSAAGPRPAAAIRDVLERFSGIEELTIIPDDRDACDAAMLAGRSLVEHAPTSPARLGVAELARRILPERVTPPPVRRNRFRR
ncbi:MAG: ParA family protein [Intrasporangiaceae bacterium]|nr:ParA family protein [Intrasporangiaceae bacterium]